MKRAALLISLPVLLVVATPRATAGGFLVYDLSAEALGRGSAVSASTQEPAAVWFNPSALSFMPGYRVSLGAIYINASANFTAGDGSGRTEALPGNHVIPTVFGTVQIAPWFTVGLGLYSAWGLSIEWPEDWLGREHAIRAAITTVSTGPVFSFMLWKKRLSLAVGFDVVRGVVELRNGLPEVVGGTVDIGGSTFGFGGNASLSFRILPGKLHAAFAYRTRVELRFNNGRADFDPVAEEFAHDLRDQGGKAVITLPDMFTLGVMYRPIPKLTLTMDLNITLWSVFDQLALDFESAPDIALHRNWKNVVTFRLGADYATPIRNLHARVGFIVDQNPSPAETLSPTLPDANRVNFSLGVGYRYKWFKVDVAYLLAYFLPSESTTGREGPAGTYRSLAHLIGLTLTASFRTGRGAAAPATKAAVATTAPRISQPPRAKARPAAPAARRAPADPRITPRPAATPPPKTRPAPQE